MLRMIPMSTRRYVNEQRAGEGSHTRRVYYNYIVYNILNIIQDADAIKRL